MSEKDIIGKTQNLNTINSLYENLGGLGINNGDILLVHSSLSSLGWVCGGAQTVVEALIKVVGRDGTLVMPAHSGGVSDPAKWQNPPVPKEWIQEIYNSMPAFDAKITPTRSMGCIPEIFRTFPDVTRSNHPHVSFCARGKEAINITKNHPLTPQLGIDSPIGKMYNLNAKILLLGVGYDKCTSLHLAETFINGMPKVTNGAPILENGDRCWKWFEDYDYNTEYFEIIGKKFEENYDIRKGKVGNAECRLFDMKEAVDFAKGWLSEYRNYIINTSFL